VPQRDIADGVVSEECHRGRAIVGASFGGGVDDCEDCVAPGRRRKGSILNQELLSTKERDPRPIDELSQILLGVDRRVIVVAQIGVKLGTAPYREIRRSEGRYSSRSGSPRAQAA
jgi:hypothetical protein